MSGVVKHQNLETPENLPDRLVIVCRARILRMLAERVHESTHVVASRPLPAKPLEKRCGGAKLPRPAEHVLVRPIDFSGAARSRNGEFVAAVPETGPGDGPHYLSNDLFKNRVIRGEGDAPLNLDLQRRVLVRMDDDIVERKTVLAALKRHAFNLRAGQAPWLPAGQ
ncbi:MAG: hypothetical protein EPN45_12920 [Rhizobiaceae bacterium]|nr:MAG: hypothetical protein EPN45_12920 [Rhizobiaceae bacterium]